MKNKLKSTGMINKFRNFKQKLGKWPPARWAIRPRGFWVIIIFLVLGVGGYFLFNKNSKNESAVATVQKGEVKEELILIGSIKADKHVLLYFPTGGKVAGVYVKEGETVKRGKALTALDRTVLNSAYQQALNTHRSYQSVAERAVDSVKGHDSDETFVQKETRTVAEAARDSAYVAVAAAEYNLRNATLYAPFDGLITSLPFPSPGVNVSAADVQVELVDQSTIYFDVDADQNDVTNIVVGQNVDIVLDSFSGEPLRGKVTFVSVTPKANTTGTTYKVKVVFNEINTVGSVVRIGMTGDARFILSQKNDVLYVPSEFVNTDKDGRFVYKGVKREKIRVETGIEGEIITEIVSGIDEGDVLYND